MSTIDPDAGPEFESDFDIEQAARDDAEAQGLVEVVDGVWSDPEDARDLRSGTPSGWRPTR